MSTPGDDPQADGELAHLPKEPVDPLTQAFVRFLGIEAAAGAVLLLFTVAAVVLSNSPWAGPFLDIWETPIGLQIGSMEYARSLSEWINDGLMTLFFFLIALELKRELTIREILVVAIGYGRYVDWGALGLAGLGLAAVAPSERLSSSPHRRPCGQPSHQRAPARARLPSGTPPLPASSTVQPDRYGGRSGSDYAARALSLVRTSSHRPV